MKPAYGETICGEVSIFRGGAGGLSYFSSGSFGAGSRVGTSWADALDTAISTIRQINELAGETVEYLMPSSEYRTGESSKRFTTVQSRTTSLALLLNENSDFVENYLRYFGDIIESRRFFAV